MKLGFVGNSHMLAYKSAEADILLRYPDAQLTYVTVSNPDFFRNAVKNRHGLRYDASKLQGGLAEFDPNGPDRMDFNSFDHVFLTSHAFYIGPLLEILATFDILDLTPVGRDRLISWPCIETILNTRLSYYARRLKAFFPLAKNVTILQAPYPCEQALATHPHLAAALQQPDLKYMFARYNQIIATHLGPLEAQFIPVSTFEITGPFVMRAEHARALDLAGAEDIRPRDYTHVNARFALRMVETLLARVSQ